MTSRAATVDQWMREAPAERRDALEQVRGIFRRILHDYQECMEYGGPCYKRNGRVEVGFNSQKQHITVYVMRTELVDEFRGTVRASFGKCCIRFAPRRVDFAAVERILRRIVEAAATPC